MGRRWWQKEARRLQNDQVKVQEDAVPVEETAIITDEQFSTAEDAADELAEIVSMIEAEDVDQVTLSPEQASIEDAKDAAIVVPVVVTQNKNVIDNKKKRR